MSGGTGARTDVGTRGVLVREAMPADVPLIVQFIRDLAAYEKEPEAAVATEEAIHRNLFGRGFGKGPVAECVIGEVDGVAQGFAVFFMNFSTWVGEPGLYLEDLFVRPEARGRGLGKALLLHLAKIAHARGCGRMEWNVLDWNTPALEFYRALGAKPMDGWTIHRVDRAGIAKLAGME